MNWTNQNFSLIGLLQMTLSLFIIIIVIIGFLFFINILNYLLLIIFLLFLLISLIFTLAVLIYLFIATKIRYFNESLGCNTQYKGLFQLWNSIDIYLQSIDEIFCSIKCPCYFNRTTSMKFLKNPYLASYYNLWYFSNLQIQPIKFQDCDSISYHNAYNNYLMRNSYFNYTLNNKKFDKYFSYIEKKFKCTGFCGLTYFNENTMTNSKIVKYLFSDVREVPENFGCLKQILNYLIWNINIFGIIFFILLILQVTLLILVLIRINILNIENNNQNMSNSSQGQIKSLGEDNIPNILKEENKKEEINSNKSNSFNIQGTFTPNSSQIEETNNIKFLPSQI